MLDTAALLDKLAHLHHPVDDNPIGAGRLEGRSNDRKSDPRPRDVETKLKPSRDSVNELQ